MATVLNVFRLATRHARSFTQGPSATCAFSTSSVARNKTPLLSEEELAASDPVGFQVLREVLKESDKAKQTTKESLGEVLIRDEYNVRRKHTGGTRGATPLTHQLFVKPYDFSFQGRKGRPFNRTPFEVGPDARLSKHLDTFYQLQLDPLHEATNSTLLSAYVTRLGKILSRAETQLTCKSQRRLRKAICRARMMGLIPQLSRRPLGGERSKTY